MKQLVEFKRQTLLGLDSMWLKTTALQKAGVTEIIFKKKKQKRDCIEKIFLQMHATNNHSDIILSLKFLLIMFLSDASMVSKRNLIVLPASGQS